MSDITVTLPSKIGNAAFAWCSENNIVLNEIPIIKEALINKPFPAQKGNLSKWSLTSFNGGGGSGGVSSGGGGGGGGSGGGAGHTLAISTNGTLWSWGSSGAKCDDIVIFKFNNKEDAMAFKLRWV